MPKLHLDPTCPVCRQVQACRGRDLQRLRKASRTHCQCRNGCAHTPLVRHPHRRAGCVGYQRGETYDA